MRAFLVIFGGLAARDQNRPLQVTFEMLDFRGRDEYFSLGINRARDIPLEVVDFLEEGGLRLQARRDERDEFVSPSELLSDAAAISDKIILPEDLS